uniref:Uncharacterized protein n=1 Tax=Globodera rostochiensis TaxID=31243 RepID=A0A914HH16_GLORO
MGVFPPPPAPPKANKTHSLAGGSLVVPAGAGGACSYHITHSLLCERTRTALEVNDSSFSIFVLFRFSSGPVHLPACSSCWFIYRFIPLKLFHFILFILLFRFIFTSLIPLHHSSIPPSFCLPYSSIISDFLNTYQTVYVLCDVILSAEGIHWWVGRSFGPPIELLSKGPTAAAAHCFEH